MYDWSESETVVETDDDGYTNEHLRRLVKNVGQVAEASLNISNNTFEMVRDLVKAMQATAPADSAIAKIDVDAYDNVAFNEIERVKRLLRR